MPGNHTIFPDPVVPSHCPQLCSSGASFTALFGTTRALHSPPQNSSDTKRGLFGDKRRGGRAPGDGALCSVPVLLPGLQWPHSFLRCPLREPIFSSCPQGRGTSCRRVESNLMSQAGSSGYKEVFRSFLHLYQLLEVLVRRSTGNLCAKVAAAVIKKAEYL